MDINKLSSDLLFPAIVALLASFFSYRATYIVANKSKVNEKADQVKNLFDNLKLQFDKLVSVFDTLSSDIENLSYYSLTNIQKGHKVIDSLNNYMWSTYLLGDSNLRLQIIEAVDNASSLINEISGLENYPFSELQKAEEKRNGINREYRQLRVDLLSEGIVFKGKELKAKFIKKTEETKKDDEKLEIANNILNEYLSELRKVDDNINNITNKNEKRRPLLATRIVDQKTKIRDLIFEINNQEVDD